MNRVKASAAVALKWRILNGLNAPVMDLSTASITVTTLDCETGKTADQGGEKAAGGSGLQNLGGGYYQLNWKSSEELRQVVQDGASRHRGRRVTTHSSSSRSSSRTDCGALGRRQAERAAVVFPSLTAK